LYEPNIETNKKKSRSGLRSLITEPSKLDQLISSEIFVLLLDVSQLGKDKKNEDVLSKIMERAVKSAGKKIYLIIMYTKFDIVKKQKLKKINLLPDPPGTWQNSLRYEYGSKLARKYYPKLFRSLNGIKPEYYFIFLNVETNSKGKKIPKLSNDIDIELDYSYHEYYKFIEQLGKISKDLN
jgi:hypothetical protein